MGFQNAWREQRHDWVLSARQRNTMFSWLQFCPRCLAEDVEPYFRRYWRVVAMTCCLRHGCVLIDACPICHQPIGRTPSTECRNCPSGADPEEIDAEEEKWTPYAAAPITPASPLGMAVQRAIVHRVGQLPPGSNGEATQFRALTKLMLRDYTVSQIASLKPLERHIILADVADNCGVSKHEVDTLKSTHDRWAVEIAAPLLQKIEIDRLNKDPPPHSGSLRDVHRMTSCRSKRGSDPSQVRSMRPAARIAFHTYSFADPCVAAAAYWTALLKSIAQQDWSGAAVAEITAPRS